MDVDLYFPDEIHESETNLSHIYCKCVHCIIDMSGYLINENCADVDIRFKQLRGA